MPTTHLGSWMQFTSKLLAAALFLHNYKVIKSVTPLSILLTWQGRWIHQTQVWWDKNYGVDLHVCTPCRLLFKSSIELCMASYISLRTGAVTYGIISICTQMCTCATIPSWSRNRCIQRCIPYTHDCTHMLKYSKHNYTCAYTSACMDTQHYTAQCLMCMHTTPNHTIPYHTTPHHTTPYQPLYGFTYSYRSIHILYSFLGLSSVAWVSACMFFIRWMLLWSLVLIHTC